MSGGQFRASRTPSSHPLVRTLAKCHAEEYGQAAHLCAAPYGCDMRLLVHEARIPTVLYGPGNVAQAHATDEWVSLSEVRKVLNVLQLAVQCLLEPSVALAPLDDC